MEILLAIFLGIFQGITEFLPVSSSGHLVFFEKIFGETLKLTKQEEHLFNVVLHLATTLAVILVFRKTIISMFGALFKKQEYINIKKSPNLWFIVLIIIATIPTGLIGIFGKKYFDIIANNLLFIGFMFFITASLLFSTLAAKRNNKDSWEKISIIDALIVGIVQGIAILPGISRSGATISTSRYLGISREKAGEFSFIISIPAIIGAAILELPGAGIGNNTILIFIAGFISSFIAGYFSLKFLIFFIKKGKIYYFAFYVIIIGILSIVLHWRGI